MGVQSGRGVLLGMGVQSDYREYCQARVYSQAGSTVR